MKRKIVFLLISLILLTGCSNVYNISIEGDTISEEIISTIPSSDIPVRTEEEIAAGIEADDPITPFIQIDQHPFVNNDKIKYKKTVTKDGINTIVKLNYDYSIDSFKDSRVYNECFEKASIKREDGYLILAFMGNFDCLYGDSLDVNITTDREVLNDNADNVDDNVYTWKIDESNRKEVNIQMILDDSYTANDSKITLILIGILVLFIVIDGYFIFRKKKG